MASQSRAIDGLRKKKIAAALDKYANETTNTAIRCAGECLRQTSMLPEAASCELTTQSTPEMDGFLCSMTSMKDLLTDYQSEKGFSSESSEDIDIDDKEVQDLLDEGVPLIRSISGCIGSLLATLRAQLSTDSTGDDNQPHHVCASDPAKPGGDIEAHCFCDFTHLNSTDLEPHPMGLSDQPTSPTLEPDDHPHSPVSPLGDEDWIVPPLVTPKTATISPSSFFTLDCPVTSSTHPPVSSPVRKHPKTKFTPMPIKQGSHSHLSRASPRTSPVTPGMGSSHLLSSSLSIDTLETLDKAKTGQPSRQTSANKPKFMPQADSSPVQDAPSVLARSTSKLRRARSTTQSKSKKGDPTRKKPSPPKPSDTHHPLDQSLAAGLAAGFRAAATPPSEHMHDAVSARVEVETQRGKKAINRAKSSNLTRLNSKQGLAKGTSLR
eukprot:GHVN01053154.1.p1 GENE.GHVN01053154.1~~GHVN01053154.1.p1  ORF type:complete len:509 (-),score=108.95 GHVN01053154.1:2200-3507(-)